MRGRRWAVMAALVAAGTRSRSDHRTGSPALAAQAAAGIANSGALEGATRTERVGRARGGGVQLVDRRGELGGGDALDVRAAQALRLGRLADADDLRVAGLLGAGRAEVVERGLRRVGQLVAVGEQDRRAQRPAHQLRGGDRRAPVLDVDERDGGRAGVARARGVDRLRHARGVGDRVGAAHARRVLRGEAGEAEVLRRLLVVAALPDHGLARLVGVSPCRSRRSRRRMRPGRASGGALGRARPWTR